MCEREAGSSLGRLMIAYPFCCWEVEGTWGLPLTQEFMEFSEYTLMSTSYCHPSLHQLVKLVKQICPGRPGLPKSVPSFTLRKVAGHRGGAQGQ